MLRDIEQPYGELDCKMEVLVSYRPLARCLDRAASARGRGSSTELDTHTLPLVALRPL